MENYKIRVESEVESKEAQDLLFELGCFWNIKGREKDYLNIGSFTHLTTFDKYIGQGFGFVDHKEITLPELRDLVVLKRNDVGDSNYKLFISPSQGYLSLYKDSNDIFYAYAEKSKSWDKSKSVSIKTKNLKPIEKPMKEYLIKINGNYKLCNLLPEDATEEYIEIPEGAEVAVYYKYKDKVFFWKDAGKTHWGESSRLQLGWYDCSANMFTRLDEFLNEWADQATVIWKRETSNDQVASAETARQSEKVLKEILEGDLPDFEAIDAFIESSVEQDNVNQPVHYCSHPSGIECIEITRHHDFAIGNAIKYLWRAGLKDSSNEIQDLEKSIWYIQDKINQLKKQNENSCKD